MIEEDDVRLLGRRLSPKDVEKQLGIPRSTISTWQARAEVTQLRRIGFDRKGDPLFWEVDIIAVALKLPIYDDDDHRLYTIDDLSWVYDERGRFDAIRRDRTRRFGRAS